MSEEPRSLATPLSSPTSSPGRVALVGAGPGDPGLITVRGREALAEADVVVYDRLANPRLLEHAPAHAERIYVGKQPGDRSWRQSQINVLLIERARDGQVVCRLKGGDPFVFGRGGEEAVALAQAGVSFEVVPGVSSAVAVPAYAGIPVTYRGLCSAFGVLAGQGERDGQGRSLPLPELARGLDTLVFLMGVESLPEIVTGLLEGGRSPETPVALIRWGTWPGQQTLVGTLATIVDQARSAGFQPPAVTVVGEVVRLREQIRWFDNRPLFGRRVLVTRAREQAQELCRLLRSLGAEPVELPLIRMEAVDPEAGWPYPHGFDWVIFASTNSVTFLWQRLASAGQDWRSLGGARVAAVGPATAQELMDHHLRADFIPDEYEAAAIISQFPEELTGRRVLLPRAADAPNALLEGLVAAGANVEVLPVYRNVPDGAEANEIRRQLENGELDAITFASSSAVRNFQSRLPDAKIESCLVACIGPSTAATAGELGIPVSVTAREHTVRGLVEALREAFLRSPENEDRGRLITGPSG
jgi:uroporphyrinogen III methyltransferase/synthase